MIIGGKKIYKSTIKLQENDVFIAMSDGCPHAGIGTAYNFGWKREDIISFMESIAPVGYTAKTLSTILVDECDKLYEQQARRRHDRLRRAHPQARADEPALRSAPPTATTDDRMMSLFFSKEGKHIVCGGTTSSDRGANIWQSRCQAQPEVRSAPTCRPLRRSRASTW